jgi:hypothetical protein
VALGRRFWCFPAVWPVEHVRASTAFGAGKRWRTGKNLLEQVNPVRRCGHDVTSTVLYQWIWPG